MPSLLVPVQDLKPLYASSRSNVRLYEVEMFKVRMQGQYGDKTDKWLRDVAKEMWTQWGFRKGIMRGYWVRIRVFGCARSDLKQWSP